MDTVRAGLAAAQHDLIAQFGSAGFDVQGQRRMVRGGDVRQDDTNGVSAVGDQAASQQIGAVALLTAELQNPIPGLGVDFRGVVQSAGDSRHGNPRYPGNILDSHTPHEHSPSLNTGNVCSIQQAGKCLRETLPQENRKYSGNNGRLFEKIRPKIGWNRFRWLYYNKSIAKEILYILHK